MSSAHSHPPRSHDADPNDAELSAAASAELARSPALQLVAELLTRLREMKLPWWTPQQLRSAYPASERMQWLAARPDLRQRITTELTGLAPRAARNKSPGFQAELIDSVVDEGDISVEDFERAFDPADLALYGPAADQWRLFRRRAPWDDDATAHQDLLGWLMGALLADKSSLDGAPRRPLLGALDLRTAIDGRVWHTRIPLHVRVAIDDARFAHQRERPGEPYGAERDLAIATPALIAASVPLVDLKAVLDVAEGRMGFAGAEPSSRGHREASPRAAADHETSDDAPRRRPTSESERGSSGVSESAPGALAAEAAPKRESVAPPAVVAPPAERPAAEPSAPGRRTIPEIVHADGQLGFGEGILDEPTADSRERPLAEGEELEHTNPWAVPAMSPEMEKIARELVATPAATPPSDPDDEG